MKCAEPFALALLLWAIVSASVIAAPGDSPGGDPVISTAVYREQVSKVAADIKLALAQDTVGGGAAAPPALSLALSDVDPIVQRAVVYGGSIIYVDNRPLRSTLTRAVDATGRTRTEILEAVVRQLSAAAAGFSVDADGERSERAGDAARAVLRQYEFGSDPYPPPSWMEKQLDTFGDWLSRELSKLFGHHVDLPSGSINPDIARGILIAILILAAALLCWIIYEQSRSWMLRRQRTVDGSVLQSALAINEQEAALVSARDYARLFLLAKQSAERGQFRNGYRLVYLATLVLLDTTGNVRIRRSRTNWEYLAAIKDAGKEDLHAMMLPLTEEFDRIWYGFGTVDRGDFEKAAQAFEAITALVVPVATGTGQRSRAAV